MPVSCKIIGGNTFLLLAQMEYKEDYAQWFNKIRPWHEQGQGECLYKDETVHVPDRHEVGDAQDSH